MISSASGRPMRIGEAAERTGIPAKTIRFYEQIGLRSPAERLENRYRSYTQRDLQTLQFIRRARNMGFSVKEVSELLRLYRDRNRTSRDVKRLALAHVAELDRKIAELAALRYTIAELARRCHGDQRPECPILKEFADIAPSRRREPGSARPNR